MMSERFGIRLPSFSRKKRKQYALERSVSVEELSRRSGRAVHCGRCDCAVDATEIVYEHFGPRMGSNRPHSAILAPSPLDNEAYGIEMEQKRLLDIMAEKVQTEILPVEVVMRRTKENFTHRARPPSWIRNLPKFLFSEESSDVEEEEEEEEESKLSIYNSSWDRVLEY